MQEYHREHRIRDIENVLAEMQQGIQKEMHTKEQEQAGTKRETASIEKQMRALGDDGLDADGLLLRPIRTVKREQDR